MSKQAALRVLQNELILRQMPFWEKGLVPGPQPAIRLPIDKVLVDKEKETLYMTLKDLIEVVRAEVLFPQEQGA